MWFVEKKKPWSIGKHGDVYEPFILLKPCMTVHCTHSLAQLWIITLIRDCSSMKQPQLLWLLTMLRSPWNSVVNMDQLSICCCLGFWLWLFLCALSFSLSLLSLSLSLSLSLLCKWNNIACDLEVCMVIDSTTIAHNIFVKDFSMCYCIWKRKQPIMVVTGISLCSALSSFACWTGLQTRA